jgi:hypothetical protein
MRVIAASKASTLEGQRSAGRQVARRRPPAHRISHLRASAPQGRGELPALRQGSIREEAQCLIVERFEVDLFGRDRGVEFQLLWRAPCHGKSWTVCAGRLWNADLWLGVTKKIQDIMIGLRRKRRMSWEKPVT